MTGTTGGEGVARCRACPSGHTGPQHDAVSTGTTGDEAQPQQCPWGDLCVKEEDRGDGWVRHYSQTLVGKTRAARATTGDQS